MSLLSSHRLHWGSHHALADHFQIIVDHLMHPSAPGAGSPETPGPAEEGAAPAGTSPSADTANARLESLGP